MTTSDLTPEGLDEIEKAAKEAAFPAMREWFASHDAVDDMGGRIAKCGIPEEAQHIANMDPATTLALVAEVKRQRAVIEQVREIIGPVEALDPDQGGCEGAWDEQLMAILDAIGQGG